MSSDDKIMNNKKKTEENPPAVSKEWYRSNSVGEDVVDPHLFEVPNPLRQRIISEEKEDSNDTPAPAMVSKESSPTPPEEETLSSAITIASRQEPVPGTNTSNSPNENLAAFSTSATNATFEDNASTPEAAATVFLPSAETDAASQRVVVCVPYSATPMPIESTVLQTTDQRRLSPLEARPQLGELSSAYANANITSSTSSLNSWATNAFATSSNSALSGVANNSTVNRTITMQDNANDVVSASYRMQQATNTTADRDGSRATEFLNATGVGIHDNNSIARIEYLATIEYLREFGTAHERIMYMRRPRINIFVNDAITRLYQRPRILVNPHIVEATRAMVLRMGLNNNSIAHAPTIAQTLEFVQHHIRLSNSWLQAQYGTSPQGLHVERNLLQALQIFALEEARFFHQVGLHDMDAAAVALNSIGNNSIGNYIGSNTTSANAITTSAITSANASAALVGNAGSISNGRGEATTTKTIKKRKPRTAKHKNQPIAKKKKGSPPNDNGNPSNNDSKNNNDLTAAL